MAELQRRADRLRLLRRQPDAWLARRRRRVDRRHLRPRSGAAEARRRPVRHRAALHRCGRDVRRGRSSTSSTSRRPSPATGHWSRWRPRTACRRSARSRSRRRSPTPRPWSKACDRCGRAADGAREFPLAVADPGGEARRSTAARSASRSSGRISFRSGYDVFSGQPYLANGKRFIIEDLGIHIARHRPLPARRRVDASPRGRRASTRTSRARTSRPC